MSELVIPRPPIACVPVREGGIFPVRLSDEFFASAATTPTMRGKWAVRRHFGRVCLNSWCKSFPTTASCERGAD